MEAFFFTFRVNLLFFEALLDVFFSGWEEFFELRLRRHNTLLLRWSPASARRSWTCRWLQLARRRRFSPERKKCPYTMRKILIENLMCIHRNVGVIYYDWKPKKIKLKQTVWDHSFLFFIWKFEFKESVRKKKKYKNFRYLILRYLLNENLSL